MVEVSAYWGLGPGCSAAVNVHISLNASGMIDYQLFVCLAVLIMMAGLSQTAQGGTLGRLRTFTIGKEVVVVVVVVAVAVVVAVVVVVVVEVVVVVVVVE